tara:strand:- start:1885 stop:2058 length:174 start_codon:yes stop_codon:yes gene_type:complete
MKEEMVDDLAAGVNWNRGRGRGNEVECGEEFRDDGDGVFTLLKEEIEEEETGGAGVN